LKTAYEAQIAELNSQLSAGAAEMSISFENRIAAMATAHEEAMRNSSQEYEARIADLINDYESKLSNTLIHSNSQNSRLNDEIERSRIEGERIAEQISNLTMEVQQKDAEVAAGVARMGELELQLRNEAERFLSMESEYSAFRENALLSTDEKVTELNNQIAAINQNHSEYVAELCTRIDDLNVEVRNLGSLFEATSNQLSEAENNLDVRSTELAEIRAQNEQLANQLSEGDQAAEIFKAEVQAQMAEAIGTKELEYQKLLAENTNLIIDIDRAQDKIEAQDAELDLLRTELQELKMISAGKTQDFKEILAARNFEMTSLEASNAALKAELELQKESYATIQQENVALGERVSLTGELQVNYDRLVAEKAELMAEVTELQDAIVTLNITIQDLNNRFSQTDSQLASLREQVANAEKLREEISSSLGLQIDGLNDEKITLLEEKEQMASQLLKMNEVVGHLSQQIESEHIDVTGLNNHRRNLILAGNSQANAEQSPVRKQINELVREIDKCIALLSA
jgi:chromosome segregation ATPase